MPLELKDLTELENTYDTFLFDVWGVLYDGEEVYPGVAEALTALRKAGKKVGIISNSTLTVPQLEEKFAKFGLIHGQHFDNMITSGAYLQHLIGQDFFKKEFQKDNYTFYCYGQHNQELFKAWASHECETLAGADFVYLGALTDNATPIADNTGTQQFLAECLSLGKPLICANPDMCATKKGKIYYTQGAIADAYERMGGKVYWMGKPYPEIFDFACQTLGSDKKTSVMIGDSLHTDIAGAQTAGLDSVLIHGTGILAHLPKSKLSEEMEKEGAVPTYALEKVALSKDAVSTQSALTQGRSREGK